MQNSLILKFEKRAWWECYPCHLTRGVFPFIGMVKKWCKVGMDSEESEGLSNTLWRCAEFSYCLDPSPWVEAGTVIKRSLSVLKGE